MLFDSTLRRELARSFGGDAGRHPDHRPDDDADPHPRPGRAGPGLAAGRGAAAGLYRARPSADDAGAVAVHRHRRPRSGACTATAKWRSGSPAASAWSRFVRTGAAQRLAGAAGGGTAGVGRLALGQPATALDLRDRYQQRSDLSRVAPGVFQTSARRPAHLLHRARQPRRARTARNVFILSQRRRRSSRSLGAAAAASNGVDDDRMLVLQRGQRNDVDDAQRREDDVALRGLPRAGRATAAAQPRRAQPPKASRTMELSARADPAPSGRTGLAARAAAAARPTCCCSASACPRATRAAPATGTCCSRCSPSSSTTT